MTHRTNRTGITRVACACLALAASANAATRTITIRTKPGDPKTYTSMKLFKNNGGMSVSIGAPGAHPGADIDGPAAGATGQINITDLAIGAGNPLTLTFDNPDGTINYRIGGYDYTDRRGRPRWVGACTDPIAFSVIAGGASGTDFLGYPIPAGQYGYFYQMYPNGTNPSTVLKANIDLGPLSGAYNFQVLNDSFPHAPNNGFDLDDLAVPLKDPPDGYVYEVVEYMEDDDATGMGGIPTAWSFDAATGVATMDFAGSPDGGLTLGQTGSIVGYTSPYAPAMLLDNVDVDYEGGEEPPCTGTFVNEAVVPSTPPQFFFDALPELPGGASEALGFVGQADGSTMQWPILSVGRSLDGDGINKAVVWSRDGTDPWQIDVLPNPFGNTESTALACEGFPNPRFVCTGTAKNLGGKTRPTVWTSDGTGPWTVETPPLPPDFNAGAHFMPWPGTPACPGSDPPTPVNTAGWVVPVDLTDPPHAAKWHKACDGTWTVELLPDNGPGLSSEATSAAVDPFDPTDPNDDLSIVGGSVQTDTSPQAPCVWQELGDGSFERIDLAMTPDAYLGSISACYTSTAQPLLETFVFAVGHNARIAALADLYRGVLYRRVGGVWGAPLELPPLPGMRDSRATGVSAADAVGSVWISGLSYMELSPGSEHATLWKVGPDNTVTVFDLNGLTLNLPAGVHMFTSSEADSINNRPALIVVYRDSDVPTVSHAGLLTKACTSNADCDDGGFCNGAESCDVTTGQCQPGTPPTCDDVNDCTVDACFFDFCLHDPSPAGTACSSGDPTLEGTCNDADTCDGAGTCEENCHPEGTACDDGSPWTVGDACTRCKCKGLPPADPARTVAPTIVNFGSPDTPPIPPDFFGTGSQPFFGPVTFTGAAQDSRDTIVQRSAPIDFSVGSGPTVEIELVSLDLVSEAPITVTDDQGVETQWNVRVGVGFGFDPDDLCLVATKTHPNGGTFDATLVILPRVTFTRVDDPDDERFLDYGAEGMPAIMIRFTGAPFVINLAPHLRGVIQAPSDGNFVPFVREQIPGDPESQIAVQWSGFSEGEGVVHTVGPSHGRRFIPAGEDCWVTDCGFTTADFSSMPIPANFFNVNVCSDSPVQACTTDGDCPAGQTCGTSDSTLEFAGKVLLEGADDEGPDTTVERCSDVLFDETLPSTKTTPLTLTKLRLVGCEPIVVQDCCKPPQLWTIEVLQSPTSPGPCTGQMTMTRTHDNGGTFESTFPIQPLFRFTRVNPPVVTYELDTALHGAEMLASEEPFAWVHDLYNPDTAHPCGTSFVPGVEELIPVPSVTAGGAFEHVQCCDFSAADCHTEPTGSSRHCTHPPDCSACPGACCHPTNGSCSYITEGECSSQGGSYGGIGTQCGDDQDGDGILDYFERGLRGCCYDVFASASLCKAPTDPFSYDTDGDTLSDYEELSAMPPSNPCDPCDPQLTSPTCPPDPWGSNCNHNSRLDICEVWDGTAGDCNEDGVPDECQGDCDEDDCWDVCEFAADCGTLTDADGDLMADECEPPLSVIPVLGGEKSRAISFSAPAPPVASATGGQTAIRIRMVDLENPQPPNNNPPGPCCPPANFTAFDTAVNAVCTAGSESAGYRCASDSNCIAPSTCGAALGCTAAGEMNACTRWVGPPLGYLESNDNPGLGNYRAARLQCTPYYHTWSIEGIVHAIGAEIVPSSAYEVQVFGAICKGIEDTCGAVSSPVTMTTRRAGDIATPFQGAPPLTQPNAIDVTNAVNKFRNLFGAPPKVISQVQPNFPDPNSDINAIDVVTVVDNVRGFGYTYSGPCVCPSTVPCNTTACGSASACTGLYGAGATCIKTCTSGPRMGHPCNNNLNCGSCIGGPATGAGAAGIPCDANGDCASNNCGTGTCPTGATPGFCRDRCGRCN